MIMKCGYDENEQKMYVTYVGKITADRRNINIKRSFRIVGQISFVLNSRDNGYDPQDNHQLVVMFKNHQDDNKQYQLQEEKFENLLTSINLIFIIFYNRRFSFFFFNSICKTN